MPPQSSTRTGAPVLRTRPTDECVSTTRSPIGNTSMLSRMWRPTTVAAPSGSKRKTVLALTSSTRAHSSETAVKTRSGWASEATSVATRRSARCSVASRLTSASLASGSPASARSSSSRSGERSVRSIPVVTSVIGPSSVPAIGLFDHAISRRPPSLVIQWPTCGIDAPVLAT